MKFENFFSRIRKLDLDMIWDHDRYVKASPGSTLQSSNNGLTIFYDLGRKAGSFSISNKICCKKRFWHFFENYRKSMSRSKISSWNHSESTEHSRWQRVNPYMSWKVCISHILKPFYLFFRALSYMFFSSGQIFEFSKVPRISLSADYP